MDIAYILIIIAAVIAILVILGLLKVHKRIWGHRLNQAKYVERWKEIQRRCSDREAWPTVVIDADKLLDEALKKRGFKGKSMGERLVNARKKFSDNDKVWFAHKLRNKLVHEENVKLTEPAVKDALKGIRQALKDLGAF